jgi:hypothetical protein
MSRAPDVNGGGGNDDDVATSLVCGQSVGDGGNGNAWRGCHVVSGGHLSWCCGGVVVCLS